MSLNTKAVAAANEKFWANNSELNRRPLSMDPDDAKFRKEWMKYYQQAEEQQTSGEPTVSSMKFITVDYPIDSVSIPCPDKSETPCCLSRLMIRCGHSSRIFKLELPSGPTIGGPFIEVLGNDAGEETLSIQLENDGCKKGWLSKVGDKELIGPKIANTEDIRPVVNVSGYKVDVTAPTPYKVKVLSKSKDELWDDLDFIGFFINLISLGPEVRNSYVCKVIACAGTNVFSGKIDVIPKYSCKGSVTLGYSFEREDSPVTQYDSAHPLSWDLVDIFELGKKRQAGKLKPKAKWTLDGAIEVAYGSDKYSLGSKFKGEHDSGKNPLSNQIFCSAQKFLDGVMPFLNKLDGNFCSLDIEFPKLTLELDYCTREQENGHRVELVGDIGIKLEPLFGANFTVDILNSLIYLCAGGLSGPPGIIFAKILFRIRQITKKGGGAGSIGGKGDVYVNFSIKGSLKGEAFWQVSGADSSWVPKKGGTVLDIPITLRGGAFAELRILRVSASASLEVGAKSGMSVSFSGESVGLNPGVKFQFISKGLTVYFLYYYEIGGSSVGKGPSKDPAKVGDTSANKNQFDKDSLRAKANMKREVVLWDPFPIPQEEEVVDLTEARF